MANADAYGPFQQAVSEDDAGNLYNSSGQRIGNRSQHSYNETAPVGVVSKAFGALTGIDTPGQRRAKTPWTTAAANTVRQFLPYTNDRQSVVPDAVMGMAAPFEINKRGLEVGPDGISDADKATMMMGVAGVGGAAAGLAKGNSMILGRAGRAAGLTDPLLDTAPKAVSVSPVAPEGRAASPIPELTVDQPPMSDAPPAMATWGNLTDPSAGETPFALSKDPANPPNAPGDYRWPSDWAERDFRAENGTQARGFSDLYANGDEKAALAVGALEQPDYGLLYDREGQASAPFVDPYAGVREKPTPQRALDSNGLYSVLDESLGNIQQKQGNAQSWINAFKKAGVKDAEIYWRGLDDFLKQKGNAKVTKDEIEAHLKANKVRVSTAEHNGEEGYSAENLRDDEIENLNERYSERYGDFDPVDAGYKVEPDGDDAFTLFGPDGQEIRGGYASAESAMSNAREHARDVEADRISNMSDAELFRETGTTPAANTEHYIKEEAPAGGDNYRETPFMIDAATVARKGSKGWTDGSGLSRDGIHPDSFYDHSPGWRLEANYNDMQNPDQSGTMVHEVQSRWHARGSEKGWKKSMAPEEAAALQADYDAKMKAYDDLGPYNYVEEGPKVTQLDIPKLLADRPDQSAPVFVRNFRRVVDRAATYQRDVDNIAKKLSDNEYTLSIMDERGPKEAIQNTIARLRDDLAYRQESLAEVMAEMEPYKPYISKEFPTSDYVQDPANPEGGYIPSPELRAYQDWQTATRDASLASNEARSRLTASANGAEPGPFVSGDKSDVMALLLKQGLYQSAKNGEDFFGVQGPERMRERWGSSGPHEDYGRIDPKTGKEAGVIPMTLQKLARMHDKNARVEPIIPGDRPSMKGIYGELRSLEVSPQLADTPALPFKELNNGVLGANNTWSSSRISGVQLTKDKDGNAAYQLKMEGNESSVLSEGGEATYSDADKARRGHPPKMFKSKEAAEAAMQQINADIDQQTAAFSDPAVVMDHFKNEDSVGEPFNGIRLTPELRKSIVEKGFPLFVNGDEKASLLSPFAHAENGEASTKLPSGFWKQPAVARMVLDMNAKGATPSKIRIAVGDAHNNGIPPTENAFHAAAAAYFKAEPTWKKTKNLVDDGRLQKILDLSRTKSNVEISKELGLAEGTVSKYLSRARQAAGEESPPQNMRLAARMAFDGQEIDAVGPFMPERYADRLQANNKADEAAAFTQRRITAAVTDGQSLPSLLALKKRFGYAAVEKAREEVPEVASAYESAYKPENPEEVRQGIIDAVKGGATYKAAGHPFGKRRNAVAGIIDRAKKNGLFANGDENAAIISPFQSYHGTAEAFDKADPERFDPQSILGSGFYATDNKPTAQAYAEDAAGKAAGYSGANPDDAGRGAIMNTDVKLRNAIDLRQSMPVDEFMDIANDVTQRWGVKSPVNPAMAKRFRERRELSEYYGAAKNPDIMLHDLGQATDPMLVQQVLRERGYTGAMIRGNLRDVAGQPDHSVSIAWEPGQVFDRDTGDLIYSGGSEMLTPFVSTDDPRRQ